ncbi:anthocyanin 5-aromatic acyltransferase-like protein [Corchorus olitorius]|uniref:Anthocyanin 5-aromatic acyltransferase-like protein n=1 Tax=Corchorus olitorius TaxID=93759 RepID=A0A1R3KDP2_9ROSI|nr:anthocyanin 5-aromatic acyltransferase-like protein [Corchorus olitorius]
MKRGYGEKKVRSVCASVEGEDGSLMISVKREKICRENGDEREGVRERLSVCDGQSVWFLYEDQCRGRGKMSVFRISRESVGEMRVSGESVGVREDQCSVKEERIQESGKGESGEISCERSGESV